MKKTNKTNNIQEEIIFYSQKLPPIKQAEALDFIKWLWGGPGTQEYSDTEIKKLESLRKKGGGKKLEDWKNARRYLENLMK